MSMTLTHLTDDDKMPPASPAVVFNDVCKRYKQQSVLHQISFTIEPAQSVAVVGLNGAGKTTMLRALLGFIGIDSGSISLFGQDAGCAQSRQSVVFLSLIHISEPTRPY